MSFLQHFRIHTNKLKFEISMITFLCGKGKFKDFQSSSGLCSFQDECESEIGKEQPSGISVIDCHVLKCNGKSLNNYHLQICTLCFFILVVLLLGYIETFFQPTTSTSLFLNFSPRNAQQFQSLAVQPTENKEAWTVVFRLNMVLLQQFQSLIQNLFGKYY